MLSATAGVGGAKKIGMKTKFFLFANVAYMHSWMLIGTDAIPVGAPGIIITSLSTQAKGKDNSDR